MGQVKCTLNAGNSICKGPYFTREVTGFRLSSEQKVFEMDTFIDYIKRHISGYHTEQSMKTPSISFFLFLFLSSCPAISSYLCQGT